MNIELNLCWLKVIYEKRYFHSFYWKLFELRTSLERSQNEMGWKEDNFRKEIAALQSRLQDADARQEDLAFMGHEATKPLLR
jgi:hypothetical protein